MFIFIFLKLFLKLLNFPTFSFPCSTLYPFLLHHSNSSWNAKQLYRLYLSTDRILMQTIRLFRCNLCLLHLLYCELYASTLLLYAYTPLCLFTSTPLRFWYCTMNYVLVLFYATPSLRLYTPMPVRHFFTVHFPVHFFCSTFFTLVFLYYA